eukprot:1146433-Pelagomonas_calceolata.AAC.7
MSPSMRGVCLCIMHLCFLSKYIYLVKLNPLCHYTFTARVRRSTPCPPTSPAHAGICSTAAHLCRSSAAVLVAHATGTAATQADRRHLLLQSCRAPRACAGWGEQTYRCAGHVLTCVQTYKCAGRAQGGGSTPADVQEQYICSPGWR